MKRKSLSQLKYYNDLNHYYWEKRGARAEDIYQIFLIF